MQPPCFRGDMIHLRDMHMTQVLKRHKRHPPWPSLRIHTELQTVETRKLNHFSSLAQGLELDRSLMEVKHTYTIQLCTVQEKHSKIRGKTIYYASEKQIIWFQKQEWRFFWVVQVSI